MIYSCFDVGGTAIKVGLIDEKGSFQQRDLIPTPAEGGPGIVDSLCRIVRQQQEKVPLAGIAISTAGIVNEEAGIVEYALSIPGYTGTPWKERLESEFHLPAWFC